MDHPATRSSSTRSPRYSFSSLLVLLVPLLVLPSFLPLALFIFSFDPLVHPVLCSRLPTMASGNTLPLLDLDTADFFVDPLPDLNAENSPYTPGLQVSVRAFFSTP